MDLDVLAAQTIDDQTFANFRSDVLSPKLSCPVLLLHRNPALGSMLEEPDVEREQKHLARCVHVRFLDLGHGIQEKQPIAFCQIVMNFLESI
jgi:pimeloyl-ACP methyl ester carboxylesterase